MIMAIIPSARQTCYRSLNARDNGSFVTRLKWRSALSLQTSDGAQERRDYLLAILGPDALEEIVDPGEATL